MKWFKPEGMIHIKDGYYLLHRTNEELDISTHKRNRICQIIENLLFEDNVKEEYWFDMRFCSEEIILFGPIPPPPSEKDRKNINDPQKRTNGTSQRGRTSIKKGI